jgi:glycosyltransferase involved in cell wall biosynthesis
MEAAARNDGTEEAAMTRPAERRLARSVPAHTGRPDAPADPPRRAAGRVLCVTSNFPRWEGDSTTPFVLHLAQDLQVLGWQVDVLAPHAPGAARSETLAGVRTERFRYAWPASAQTVCYRGGAMINLRKRPVEKLKLPVLVGAELLAIYRRLLTRSYDIVHSHWILPQGFTGTIASRLAGVPHVVTVHGGDLFALRGRTMSALKRLALARADAVTVNSSFTERGVSDLVPEQDKVRRIPMGVDVGLASKRSAERARALRERHRRGAGPLLVTVGRLVEEKGVDDVIRAVDLLRDQRPDVSLIVVGEGQDRGALEGLVAELGIGEHVRFLGWVEPDEVRACMAAADAFVGASRTGPDGWVEAQGLTFLESMAVGTPVVATRLGGIVDSVEDGETGLLVNERAPEEIAEAVGRIIHEPDLAPRLVAAASLRVRASFSREASAASFAELFSSVSGEGR